MARELRGDVEEAVLQALGHRERRNILEVVASSGDGVLYSDILHELGMNTGKLNYHLKLLDGVIKDDKRLRELVGEVDYLLYAEEKSSQRSRPNLKGTRWSACRSNRPSTPKAYPTTCAH